MFIRKEGLPTLFQDDNRRSLAPERHFEVGWGLRFLRGVAAELQAQLQLEWRGCGGVVGRSLSYRRVSRPSQKNIEACRLLRSGARSLQPKHGPAPEAGGNSGSRERSGDGPTPLELPISSPLVQAPTPPPKTAATIVSMPKADC